MIVKHVILVCDEGNGNVKRGGAMFCKAIGKMEQRSKESESYIS